MARHASVRSRSIAPPLSARRVLVGSVDRGVHAVPLVVDVAPKRLEQALPLALLRPPVEAIEHCLPRPELVRQVAPRHPRPAPPKHRLDESAVVPPWTPTATLSLDNRRHLGPLPLVQLRSNHRGLPMEHTFGCRERACSVHSIFRRPQKPLSFRTCPLPPAPRGGGQGGGRATRVEVSAANTGTGPRALRCRVGREPI
jgi:hypothetical protein